MKKIILLFAIGAFTSLSMAPTNFWPAIFIGLSTLFLCISKAPSATRAGLYGFAFSLGYFGFSLSWIGNALLVEDNPYWWAWPLAVSGLPIILSLFTFTFCALHKKICRHKTGIITFISFSIALILTDLARGHLFTGFPWNLYGYTWVDTPIAQVASLWNIYLLNSITIIWALTPCYILCKKKSKSSRIIIGVLSSITLIAAFTFGVIKLNAPQNEPSESYSITVVQPNIPQHEKWKQENRAKNFQTLLKLSEFKDNNLNKEAREHYIIWPETAISQDLLNSPWVSEYISKTLSKYPVPTYLITGALRYNGTNYYNSIIVIDNAGEIISTYDKTHLVPFGEYMPLSAIIDIAPIVGFTGFEKGDKNQDFAKSLKTKIRPLICYEVIFPKFNDKESDIIINVTNDAWYGDSAGPRQHLVQTRFRAIETNTPILRAANTGISAIIDNKGNISSKIPLGLQDVILGNPDKT